MPLSSFRRPKDAQRLEVGAVRMIAGTSIHWVTGMPVCGSGTNRERAKLGRDRDDIQSCARYQKRDAVVQFCEAQVSHQVAGFGK